MGISVLVKGAKSSCRQSNPIYPPAWTASSSASLCKHALKTSLKGLFPEVSRELQVPAPQTSASQRGLPTRVPNTASAGHGHVHMGTGWHYSRFHLKGNKEKVFFMHYEICMRRSHASQAPLAGPQSWAASPLGSRLTRCSTFAPCSLPPSLTSGRGGGRRLWVWKEEKQSPSLIENKLSKEWCLNSCASLGTHYLPSGPAVRAQWLI